MGWGGAPNSWGHITFFSHHQKKRFLYKGITHMDVHEPIFSDYIICFRQNITTAKRSLPQNIYKVMTTFFITFCSACNS